MPPPAPPQTILTISQDDESDPEDIDYDPSLELSTSKKRKLAAAAAAEASASAESERLKRQKLIRDGDSEEMKRIRLEEEDRKAKETLRSFLEVEDESKAERERGMNDSGSGEEEMVEVQRPRTFAGDVIYETVRLPKSHPDVIKYTSATTLRSSASPILLPSPHVNAEAGPSTHSSQSTASKTNRGQSNPQPPLLPSTSTPGSPPEPSTSANESGPASTPTPAIKPPNPRPPVRRKPKQSLEAMSAALEGGPKKISVVDKSKLDWHSHLSTPATTTSSASNTLSATDHDQLLANRRDGSGSYLERQGFLGRVGERRAAGGGAGGGVGQGRRGQ